MESPRHRLVPLLLLGLVGGAAAATGADSQAVCEPTNLATQIALFCAPNMPTAPCCEPVVASVDLGGGVPCLCRVASQQQLILARLNASHLLALYTACGGLRTGGAHLAAACQGKLHLARLSLSLLPVLLLLFGEFLVFRVFVRSCFVSSSRLTGGDGLEQSDMSCVQV
jgi:hypothetical protein